MTDMKPEISANWDKLIAFFDAGAPEVTIDMKYGVAGIDNDETVDSLSRKLDTGWCGTTACIAGIAFQMALREMPLSERKAIFKQMEGDIVDRGEICDWRPIRDNALAFLGIPEADAWYGSPIFNDIYADDVEVTPRVAANFLRRARAHYEGDRGMLDTRLLWGLAASD